MNFDYLYGIGALLFVGSGMLLYFGNFFLLSLISFFTAIILAYNFEVKEHSESKGNKK